MRGGRVPRDSRGASAAARRSQAGPPPPTPSSRAALFPATLSPGLPRETSKFQNLETTELDCVEIAVLSWTFGHTREKGLDRVFHSVFKKKKEKGKSTRAYLLNHGCAQTGREGAPLPGGRCAETRGGPRRSRRGPPACPPAGSSRAVSAGVPVKVAGLSSASASRALGTELPVGLAQRAGGAWVDGPGEGKEGLLDGASRRN